MGEVFYDSSGNWRPTINGLKCQECGVEYVGRKKHQRFCSRSCSTTFTMRNKAPEKIKKECPECSTIFFRPPSNRDVHCSRQCLYNAKKWEKAQEFTCQMCGETFFRNLRERKQKKYCSTTYCSKTCSVKGLAKHHEKSCKNCGKVFTPYTKKLVTCSKTCSNEYFSRDRSHAWKGGVVAQNGRPYRKIDREGYQAKYDGEHRLVAAREIGRNLARGEVVLCIDGNNLNHAPKNLFLCPSQKEYSMIRSGAVEFPTESNLQQYRTRGYVRPPVIIVLHEWENGQRRESKKGRPITRHPQADEIIKRRKAGATITQLCDAFGESTTVMANTLRRRL